MPGSGPKDLLDQVARHRVEEKGEEEKQQREQQHFEEQPAIRVPQEVAGRLEGVQEPDEARVRPAGAARGAEGTWRKDTEDKGWGAAKMGADPQRRTGFQAPPQPSRLPGTSNPPQQPHAFGTN